MPIKINDASVINSFSETVPKAADLGEAYLRAVARGVQEYEPPVTMVLDSLSTGSFRAAETRCLVVEPTNPRLRHFKTAHYANPMGAGLQVGWYLVGGERADGWQVGYFAFGAPTDVDADEVMSIVEMVHKYAVLPAIQDLADTVRTGHQGPGGFLGV